MPVDKFPVDAELQSSLQRRQLRRQREQLKANRHLSLAEYEKQDQTRPMVDPKAQQQHESNQ